jgi:hypothetical protein
MSENRNLPTIQELYGDVEIKEKENALNILLNQPPKLEWLKEHPIIKKIKYIPIERVEWLLTRIFIKWKVEVKEIKLLANSVIAIVRLHYVSVVTNEWEYQDGVGAAPLQTDSGAGAIEFDKIKNDAVMKAAPAAESYAVKDAAEKIGKLFGKDLNRADQILYDSLSNTFAESDIKTVQKKIIDALDSYKGTDKNKIKQQCIEKVKDGSFDMLYASIVAGKIGLKI